MNKKNILQRTSFLSLVEGQEVDLYRLARDKGLEVYVTNYGAKIVSLFVPDRNGQPVDVVLGHDSMADYLASEEQYFGGICGRYANRIAGGRFSIDGRNYTLPLNAGAASLHGGVKGFNAKVWTVKALSPTSITMEYISPDGEEGYPGELKVEMTYSIAADDTLHIDYRATTNAPTVLNLTNHSYFNLSGAGDPSVHDHLLTIPASTYLPTDENAIPYGAAERVEGTPFDFTTAHTIGERIDTPIDQLVRAKGYDHSYIIDKPIGAFGLCCSCSSPKTGIVLDVASSEPAMQVYTGNWMTGQLRGKWDQRYPARAAVCFETQHFPDSPNRPDYPSTLLRPGEEFHSETTFRLYAKA